MPLIPEPLDAVAFAPFGAVLRFDEAGARPVNEGFALRSDLAAALDHDAAAKPVVAIYRARPRPLPLRLGLFECHPGSAQAFVPLTAERFLVVVAQAGPDGLPDPASARAFVGKRDTGVLYRRGVWHAPLTILDEGGEFMMLMGERGVPGDCIEHRLAAPLLVSS